MSNALFYNHDRGTGLGLLLRLKTHPPDRIWLLGSALQTSMLRSWDSNFWNKWIQDWSTLLWQPPWVESSEVINFNVDRTFEVGDQQGQICRERERMLRSCRFSWVLISKCIWGGNLSLGRVKKRVGKWLHIHEGLRMAYSPKNTGQRSLDAHTVY